MKLGSLTVHEILQFACLWNIAVSLSMKHGSFTVHETWKFHCPWNMVVLLSMKHGSFTDHETGIHFYWAWNCICFVSLVGILLSRFFLFQILFTLKLFIQLFVMLLGLQSTEGLGLPTLTCQVRYTSKSIGPYGYTKLTCQVRYTSKSIGPYGYTKLETPDPVRTLKWCNLGHG